MVRGVKEEPEESPDLGQPMGCPRLRAKLLQESSQSREIERIAALRSPDVPYGGHARVSEWGRLAEGGASDAGSAMRAVTNHDRGGTQRRRECVCKHLAHVEVRPRDRPCRSAV